jgi:hypothetical protein
MRRVNMLDQETRSVIEGLKREIALFRNDIVLFRKDVEIKLEIISDRLVMWSTGTIAVTGTLAFLIAAHSR